MNLSICSLSFITLLEVFSLYIFQEATPIEQNCETVSVPWPQKLKVIMPWWRSHWTQTKLLGTRVGRKSDCVLFPENPGALVQCITQGLCPSHELDNQSPRLESSWVLPSWGLTERPGRGMFMGRRKLPTLSRGQAGDMPDGPHSVSWDSLSAGLFVQDSFVPRTLVPLFTYCGSLSKSQLSPQHSRGQPWGIPADTQEALLGRGGGAEW